MRVITLEEHFRMEPLRTLTRHLTPVASPRIGAELDDLGERRLAAMDAAGIDVQILSPQAPSVQALDAADAVPLARDVNDALAGVIAGHPDRYGGFATVATSDPGAAAAELERTVRHLGFKGAIVHGHTQGRFLDAPEFAPLLECAEALDVPIYLHPTPPTPAVFEAYFSGLDAPVASVLSRAGWGWHAETGLHSLRLVASGVFDRFPRLQVVIGHMGENIPFSLARADHTLAPVTKHLQRRVADYFCDNFHVTTSAYFTVAPLQCALSVLGADRILFSVDYPFSDMEEGMAFLRSAPISPADRAKIAHGNAERLLRL